MQQPNPEDFEATWNYIENGIKIFLADDLSDGLNAVSYMNIYTTIHNYCIQSTFPSMVSGSSSASSIGPVGGTQFRGADLYKALSVFLKNHLQSKLAVLENLSSLNLINQYNFYWDRYTTGCKYLDNIFAYLNRHWVRHEREEGHKDVYEIYTLALHVWKEFLFDKCCPSLRLAVLEQIKEQRDGVVINTTALKTTLQSFISLGLDDINTKKINLDVYKTCFEEQFLEATRIYYTEESALFLRDHPVDEYMKLAEKRLNEEATQITYIESSTEPKLILACLDTLVSAHREKFYGEFVSYLDQEKESDYHRMFMLLSRVENGLKPLEEEFQKYVQQKGLREIDQLLQESVAAKKPVDPKSYVMALLRVQVKYHKLVKESFNNNTDLVKSFDNGCRLFINNNPVAKPPGTPAGKGSKSAEFLAKYADQLLKKSSGSAAATANAQSDDIESLLDDVMTIFKYLDEKDSFEINYSKLLAKRLVSGSSGSDDAEQIMVSKLKEECGHDYTSKLSKMFSDIMLSADLQRQFVEYAEKEGETVSDCSVTILAANAWPMSNSMTEFIIPHALAKSTVLFEKFYLSAHESRRLQWAWGMCKGEVKYHSEATKTPYIFGVSIVQLSLLLAFNEKLSMTIEEISNLTGVPFKTLNYNVSHMITAKLLIPSQHPLTPGTTLTLNKKWKGKKQRINFNIPAKSEAKAEQVEIDHSIEQGRKLNLRATIVRVMKARQTLPHLILMQDVIAQLQKRFSPEIREIKKAIDELVEEDYLKREDGGQTISYVA